MARRYKYGMRMQDASKILLCIAYYYYYRTTSKLLLVLPYYYKLRTKAPPDKSYEILQIPMEAWSTEAKANQGLTYCSGK